MRCIRVAPNLGAWLAICVIACGGDGPTTPVNDPRGMMLVVSGTGSAQEIYTMRPDGSDRLQLTHNAVLDNDPDWSPDGRQIVYISAVDSEPGAPGRRRDVFLMNADGSGSHRLFQMPGGAGSTHPRWSPDGTRISFDSFDLATGFQPYVMNSDGSNVKLIRVMPGENFGLEWSPDGTRFLFLSNRAPRFLWTMYVMPTDGSSDQQLTGNAACASNLGRGIQWSPDGSRIAFSCDSDLGSWIVTMPTDGTFPAIVTIPEFEAFGPVWSPTGAQIAFASNAGSVGANPISQIDLMVAGGGPVSPLTNEPVRQVVNAWRVH